MTDNVFTIDSIREVCGIASFLYYMGKVYGKEKDITVYYLNNESDARLERISKYVDVKKYDGGRIKCKRAFFGYDLSLINQIDAEEYYQIIHANYMLYNLALPQTDKPIKFIAVSEHAARRFREKTGADCEVVYNPMDTSGEKPLVLMSATRLAIGKGVTRINKFADALDRAGVNYIWFIFGNNDKGFVPESRNIVLCEPRIDVVQLMPIADWFVQLSDDEAFGTSMVEANAQGVPLISTPIPIVDEFDLQGVCVDYDVERCIPIADIMKPKQFAKGLKEWQQPTSRWNEVLA